MRPNVQDPHVSPMPQADVTAEHALGRRQQILTGDGSSRYLDGDGRAGRGRGADGERGSRDRIARRRLAAHAAGSGRGATGTPRPRARLELAADRGPARRLQAGRAPEVRETRATQEAAAAMRLLRRRRRIPCLQGKSTRPAEPYLAAGAAEARRLGHNYVGTEHVLL